MSADREVTRIVRSWLEEGVTALPDRVLDAVLDQVPATRQRRAWWPARRLPQMNNAIRLAFGAVAVVVASLIGLILLTGSPAPGVGGSSQNPSASPSPSTTPPGAIPVPSGSMTAGRYHIDLQTYRLGNPGVGGGTAPAGWQPDVTVRVSFEVPDGWSGNGWVIVKDGAQPTEHMSMAPWSIASVYVDPCHWQGGNTADPPMMRTRDGVASALYDWFGPKPWAKGAPTSTKPVLTRLAGMDAQLVELTVPNDINFADCDGGKYTIWVDQAGGDRYLQGPGQTDRVWVVDVDGTGSQYQSGLVAIDAAVQAGNTAADRAELQAIVDSIQITTP